MLDALHWRQQVLFILSYFPIPYVTRRPSHAHTHAYTLTHAQRLHSYIRPVFCFRFVDILIGQESGLHWTTRITHDMWAFSCSVDRCMVTACLHTSPHTRDLMEKHTNTYTRFRYLQFIEHWRQSGNHLWMKESFENWETPRTDKHVHSKNP